MSVYRVLDDGGQACTSSGRPDRDGTALFTSRDRVDRAVRWLNDPNRLGAGTPQPAGRPYRRQDGEIRWEGQR